MLFEPKPPGLVRVNHQFRDEEVQRRAAAAAAHVNRSVFALALENEEPVDAVGEFGTAAHLFSLAQETAGEVPEPGNFFGVLDVERMVFNRLFRDEFVDPIVPDVALDRDTLEPRFGLLDAEGVVVHRDVERETRNASAFVERIAFDPGLGEHRRLEARRIHRAHAGAGHLVERIVAHDPQRRHGDVHADYGLAVFAVRDRERVVDFRRARVVNREGAHLGFGQILEVERGGKRQIRGKAAAAREVLAIEAFDVPRPGALDAAELEHEAQGRHSRVGGRVGESLPFDPVLVGRHQKPHDVPGEGLGQMTFVHFGHPGAALFLAALLALERFERLLENLFGGAAVHAAALAVKVDGIAVQSEQNRGALHGRWRRTPVFLGDVFERKVAFGRHLPEKSRIEFGRRLLGRLQEFRGHRRLEREEYLRRLDLRASARRHGHLIGVARFAYDGARLEGAVLFKIQIHDVVTS